MSWPTGSEHPHALYNMTLHDTRKRLRAVLTAAGHLEAR
jgi:hypothetical protein